MADKKGAGPTSKKVEIKKAVIINGPTSKQAFRKVEEEQRARLAKQRKAEEEWLQKIIEKEEGRRTRIQKTNPKEEEQKTAQRANADNKGVDDARRYLTKSSMEAEQRQIRVEQMKRVKAVHKTQMLDRIVEETESASSGRQGIVALRSPIRSSIRSPVRTPIRTPNCPMRTIYVASSFDQL